MGDWFGFIDPKITLGNVIEIGTIASGGVWFLIRMSNTLTIVKSDVAMMQKEIVKIGEVLTKIAVTESRLNNIEDDLRELRKA